MMRELWREKMVQGVGLVRFSARCSPGSGSCSSGAAASRAGSSAFVPALTHPSRTFCGGRTTPPPPSTLPSSPSTRHFPHHRHQYPENLFSSITTTLAVIASSSVRGIRHISTSQRQLVRTRHISPSRALSTSLTRFCPASDRSSVHDPSRNTTSTDSIVNMAEEQKWPAAKVRETYLKFFEGKQHTIGSSRRQCLLLSHPRDTDLVTSSNTTDIV